MKRDVLNQKGVWSMRALVRVDSVIFSYGFIKCSLNGHPRSTEKAGLWFEKQSAEAFLERCVDVVFQTDASANAWVALLFAKVVWSKVGAVQRHLSHGTYLGTVVAGD